MVWTGLRTHLSDMARGGGRPDEGTWVALITCHARKARGRGHAVADARVMQVFGKSPVYPRKEKYTQEKKSIPKKRAVRALL